jgi:hypothetical protein
MNTAHLTSGTPRASCTLDKPRRRVFTGCVSDESGWALALALGLWVGPSSAGTPTLSSGSCSKARSESALAVEAVVTLAQFTLGASPPGTGQRLHDRYRTRAPERASGARPAIMHVARHFRAGATGVRFRSALDRMNSELSPLTGGVGQGLSAPGWVRWRIPIR